MGKKTYMIDKYINIWKGIFNSVNVQSKCLFPSIYNKLLLVSQKLRGPF